jgi:hypothetical protein
MARLLPLFDERMVRAVMALTAATVQVHARADRRERLRGVGVDDVVEARPVAALTLDVVIDRVVDRLPPGSGLDEVALVVGGVTVEAELLSIRVCFSLSSK